VCGWAMGRVRASETSIPPSLMLVMRSTHAFAVQCDMTHHVTRTVAGPRQVSALVALACAWPAALPASAPTDRRAELRSIEGFE
jgi:hypothetical protein